MYSTVSSWSLGDDAIDAIGGNDIVCGRAGDDVINGGNDADVIFGGPGADTVIGGPGDDTIFGGPGETAQTMEITPLVITITGTEEIYVNQNIVPFNKLKEALKAYKENVDDKTTQVVLKGDKDVSYGTFIQIMGILRGSGYDQINMITEQPRKK